MAKRAKRFQLFIVSVDFDTKLRKPPYPQLDAFLSTLGGVLKPTHQIRLLLSPFTASRIRTDIRNHLLRAGRDRIYVGKIARGSAWYNLLGISNSKLKAVLRTWAQAAVPNEADIAAARSAVRYLLPLGNE
jgi:hypothetical protein